MTQALQENPEVLIETTSAEKAAELNRELQDIARRRSTRHGELITVGDQLRYWVDLAPMVERAELTMFRKGQKPKPDPRRPLQSAQELEQVRKALVREDSDDEQREIAIKARVRALEVEHVKEVRAEFARQYAETVAQVATIYSALLGCDRMLARMKQPADELLAARHADVLHLPRVTPVKSSAPESASFTYGGRPHPSTLALHGAGQELARLSHEQERVIASKWALLSGGVSQWS